MKHQRGAGGRWKTTSSNMFGRGEAAVLEAARDYAAGEAVVMDYAPDRLDSEVLLDFGAMDDLINRVSPEFSNGILFGPAPVSLQS